MRRKKPREVVSLPQNLGFRPISDYEGKELVILTVDEYEALSSDEQKKYSHIATEEEAGTELDTAIHFEEHITGSGSSTPVTKSYTVTKAGVYFVFAESNPYTNGALNDVELLKNGTRLMYGTSMNSGFSHVSVHSIVTCEVGDVISVSMTNAVSGSDDYNSWGLFRIGS